MDEGGRVMKWVADHCAECGSRTRVLLEVVGACNDCSVFCSTVLYNIPADSVSEVLGDLAEVMARHGIERMRGQSPDVRMSGSSHEASTPGT